MSFADTAASFLCQYYVWCGVRLNVVFFFLPNNSPNFFCFLHFLSADGGIFHLVQQPGPQIMGSAFQTPPSVSWFDETCFKASSFVTRLMEICPQLFTLKVVHDFGDPPENYSYVVELGFDVTFCRTVHLQHRVCDHLVKRCFFGGFFYLKMSNVLTTCTFHFTVLSVFKAKW